MTTIQLRKILQLAHLHKLYRNKQPNAVTINMNKFISELRVMFTSNLLTEAEIEADIDILAIRLKELQ